jgi:hypothetical protein
VIAGRGIAEEFLSADPAIDVRNDPHRRRVACVDPHAAEVSGEIWANTRVSLESW